MADFRQIIWRESLRSRCKHSTRAQTVLPHNVAWPFCPFFPTCGRHVSAAMICGRKRPLTLNLASMLRKMVLPDNVAPQLFPQIFPRAATKSCSKNVFGRSCELQKKLASCPLLVKRGSLQIFWRFWVCREEGQPTPLLGKTASALRVSVAILMASPKVGKNPDYLQIGPHSGSWPLSVKR